MLLTKYIAFSAFVVGFASLVVEKVTAGQALWWPFLILTGSVLLMLFFYHFFIYCACSAAEKFNLIEKKND
jgi:hypothetical protein